MELSPEERARIYEEEKARIENESRHAELGRIPAVAPRIQEDATSSEPHPYLWDALLTGRARTVTLSAGCLLLFTCGVQHISDRASSEAPPAVAAKPTTTPTPDKFHSGLHAASVGDFTGAIALLKEVSKTDKNYPSAREKIKTYTKNEAIKKAAAAHAEAQRLESDRQANIAADKLANPERWVQVDDNYKWTINDEGDYEYVRGSIKNLTDNPTRYWKITADFLDSSDNVIDSAYTNSIDALVPGAARRFEIMHRQTQGAKHVKVYVSEVTFR